ncbi:MAG TPA: phage terminase small subunit P27 family [Burkholderiales bacterium]|nr:phage terminase small subunit P27 family [Burkholderiales bacterium]
MRPGRKPTPIALRELRGNPGRRPLPEDAPRPDAALPPPPEHLSERARAEWERAGRELERAGLMSHLDMAMFAAYCSAWGRLVEAEEMLAREGPVVETPKGFLVQSPYLQIMNKAIEQITRLGVEFGMSPSARVRVKAEKPKEADPLEELLKRRGG